MKRLLVKEKEARSILARSGIPGMDYCLNPYTGCSHGCRYCYATFMKRYTGHAEPWGSFVDAKVNAPELLKKQIRRAAKGPVMISSVTDPYQALEARYQLTRRCLEILLESGFPVEVLTKSPLVLRDLDLIRGFRDIEVGITITTDDDRVRKVFEPYAPPVEARIQALQALQQNGIRTYAFIGPVLPMDPEVLAARIRPCVDSVLIDRMNYLSKTLRIYNSHPWERWLDPFFVDSVIERLGEGLRPKEVILC